MTQLASRLEQVRAQISDAAGSVGRRLEDITVVVVTKFHPASLVSELVTLGVTDVGENRHPEARDKRQAVNDPRLHWHYIGQLQSNKARAVFRYADAIHSIDRAELVDVIEASPDERVIDAFIQVNLTPDPLRGGVAERELEPLVESVLGSKKLRLRGLMAVAPLDEPARPAFARVAELSQRVQALAPAARALSIGMSHDFVDAIAEGATHLRIGSAITGNRPLAG